MLEQQSRMSEPAQWFQVGVLSATLLSPLMSRWQALRASERARELWEARRAQMARPFGRAPAEAELPPALRRAPVRTGLWLAGVGVGLVAAGTVAFVVARRRLAAAEEAPVELPLPSTNGQARHLTDQAARLRARVRRSSGAGTAPDAEAPSRGAPDTSLETPPAPEPSLPNTAAPLILGGETPPLARAVESGDPAEATADDGTPPVIGNVLTLEYTAADATDLPSVKDRVYFRSAAEAEAHGYRAEQGDAAHPGEGGEALGGAAPE